MKRAHRRVIVRASITLATIALLACAALVAAAKLERERGPQADPLLRSMSEAITAKRAVSFKLTGTAKLSGNLSGEAERITSSDRVALRGYMGPNGLDVRGEIGGAKDLRLTATGSLIAVRFEGRWYGQRLPAARSGGFGPERLDPRSLRPFFQPYSYAGERVRGRPTWRLAGDFSKFEGQANPVIDVKAVLNDISFAVSVDRRTRLPVLFEGLLHGSAEDWLTVAPPDGSNPGKVDVELRFELYDWGKEKPVEAPGRFRPLADLNERVGAGPLAAGMFSAAGG